MVLLEHLEVVLVQLVRARRQLALTRFQQLLAALRRQVHQLALLGVGGDLRDLALALGGVAAGVAAAGRAALAALALALLAVALAFALAFAFAFALALAGLVGLLAAA